MPLRDGQSYRFETLRVHAGDALGVRRLALVVGGSAIAGPGAGPDVTAAGVPPTSWTPRGSSDATNRAFPDSVTAKTPSLRTASRGSVRSGTSA